MSEKKLNNIRIIHKHDTEENWLKAENFIPLKGELIIYDVDDNNESPRFKIGDGETNVNLLSFSGNTKGEADIELITVEDIDRICGTTITVLNDEVRF